MLETLCNAFGVSGCEDEIRNIILNNVKDKCDNYKIDSMGNIICYKKGYSGNHNIIMLSSHVDEVGFIVSGITKEGYLRFQTVGGIDPRILQSQKVVIGNNKINGVIGAKPAHLIDKNADEVVNPKDLLIDIGACDYNNALKFVNIGDYAVFDSQYIEFGNNKVKAKALDDRVGCYTLIRLMESSYPNDIYFCFTVQEEVGCRGAAVAAYDVKADYAIVVEGTTCSDVPGTDNHSFSTHLGCGPAISIFDGGSYSNKEVVNALKNAAETNNFSVQYKQTTMGSNDASVIHVANSGVKTGVISVPCRYIHSSTSVADKSDIDNCYNILYKLLKQEEEVPWNC